MNFNVHRSLEGQHAFLSPSRYSWVNYDEDKLLDVYNNWRAAQLGTELHEIAARLIQLGIKLPKNNKTLNMYVNDGIGFRMIPEVCLCYSSNAFGTADAIAFKNNFLRIHDYKSGRTPASIRQLEVYAALFCLEYGRDPREIEIELRIYQSNKIIAHDPDAEHVLHIMNKIVTFDKKINELNT